MSSMLPRGARLLSESEVAELLRVSTKTIQRLVKAARLQRIKVGNKNMYHPDAVSAFMAANSTAVSV